MRSFGWVGKGPNEVGYFCLVATTKRKGLQCGCFKGYQQGLAIQHRLQKCAGRTGIMKMQLRKIIKLMQ